MNWSVIICNDGRPTRSVRSGRIAQICTQPAGSYPIQWAEEVNKLSHAYALALHKTHPSNNSARPPLLPLPEIKTDYSNWLLIGELIETRHGDIDDDQPWQETRLKNFCSRPKAQYAIMRVAIKS